MITNSGSCFGQHFFTRASDLCSTSDETEVVDKMMIFYFVAQLIAYCAHAVVFHCQLHRRSSALESTCIAILRSCRAGKTFREFAKRSALWTKFWSSAMPFWSSSLCRTLDDGTEMEADVIVGADGIWSDVPTPQRMCAVSLRERRAWKVDSLLQKVFFCFEPTFRTRGGLRHA